MVLGSYTEATESDWPWEKHVGQADPCMQAFMFPAGYCDENQKIIPTEGPLAIDFNVAPVPGPSPYGGIIGGVSDKIAQPFRFNQLIEQILFSNRRGLGYFMHAGDTPYGQLVKLQAGTACDKVGDVSDNAIPLCGTPSGVPGGEGYCEFTHATSFQEEDTPYGKRIRFAGSAGCGAHTGGITDPLAGMRDEPYHTQVFGVDCYFCRFLLWTAEAPCLGCKWDYYFAPAGINCGPNDDNCTTGADFPSCPTPDHPTDDDVECIARLPGVENWRYGCAVSDDGSCTPDPVHNCPDCQEKRMVGLLAGIVIETTDALKRIPLEPIINDQEYGCGTFGWRNEGIKLDELGIAAEDTEIDEQCGCISPICFQTTPAQACEPRSVVWWDTNRNTRIDLASIKFSEREICDSSDGPCSSAPCQPNCDPDDYYTPSSQMVLWCEAIIRIIIPYAYANGLDITSSQDACCEYLLTGGSSGVPNQDRVAIITGTYDGPMLFGNRIGPGWFGYRENDGGTDYIDFGIQSGGCQSDPDGQPPLGACMNPFVNHGRIDDWFIGDTGVPFFTKPPKQCPSHIIDDTGGDRFFCPPKLEWDMVLRRTVFPGEPPTNFPLALKDTRNQCWDVEPLRNKNTCIDGTFSQDPTAVTNSGRYECTPIECRKGCNILNPSVDLDGNCNRFQPCEEQFGPRPWSCGQCKD